MKTVRCDFCNEPITGEEGEEADVVVIGDPEAPDSEWDACPACREVLDRIAGAHNLPGICKLLGWKENLDVVPAADTRQLTVGEVVLHLASMDPGLMVWNEDDRGDLGAVVGVTIENEVDEDTARGVVIQQGRAL